MECLLLNLISSTLGRFIGYPLEFASLLALNDIRIAIGIGSGPKG